MPEYRSEASKPTPDPTGPAGDRFHPPAGTWFRGALILWGLAVVLGLLGFVLGLEPLVGLSFVLRRLALAVTIIWGGLALLVTGWRWLLRSRR